MVTRTRTSIGKYGFSSEETSRHVLAWRSLRSLRLMYSLRLPKLSVAFSTLSAGNKGVAFEQLVDNRCSAIFHRKSEQDFVPMQTTISSREQSVSNTFVPTPSPTPATPGPTPCRTCAFEHGATFSCITSPNYPAKYNPNDSCVIEPDAQMVVSGKHYYHTGSCDPVIESDGEFSCFCPFCAVMPTVAPTPLATLSNQPHCGTSRSM